MKFVVLALALSVGASAQTNKCPVPYTGSVCIQDWNATVKTLRSGTLECTIWAQNLGPGLVQIACCNTTCNGVYSGKLIHNEVVDVNLAPAYGGIEVPNVGWVSWILSPMAGQPGKIDFEIVVMLAPTGPPIEEVGVF